MRIQTAAKFAEVPDKGGLAEDVFVRGRAMFQPLTGFWLPDPDPILRRQGIDMQVYREMMNDSHVDSVFQSRFSGTLSCEWSIEAADSTRPGKKAATLCADVLEALNMQQVIEQALNAVAFGYVPMAIVWEERDGLWVPGKVEGRNQDWFKFGDDGALRFLAKNSGMAGEPVDDFRILLVQNRATYDNPYGERTLSRCFWPVTFKRSSLRYWVTFVEKYGMPWPIGRVAENATDAQATKLKEELVKMVRDGVAVLRGTASIEFLNTDAGKSASAEIYNMLGQFCNAEISKAVVGQTLTTEIGPTGGAFAASKTHQEVRGDLVDRDKKMIARTMGTLMGWIVGFNAPGAPVPRFVFREEENVRMDLANRDKVLYDMGVRFTAGHYTAKYGLQEDEFEIKEPAPPPAGPSGAPPIGAPPEQPSPEEGAGKEDGPPETGGTRTAEDPNDGAGEFAETGAPAVDKLSAAAIVQAEPVLAGLVAEAVKLARAAATPEELRAALPAWYDALDVDQLSDLLARASFRARLEGSARAGKAAKGSGPEFAEDDGLFLSPEAMVRRFRAKGNKLSWSWRDVWQQEHEKAFTVARLSKMDVLQDIRDAMDKAISEGMTFPEFQDQLEDKLKEKGWWGQIEGVDPATGEVSTIQAGSPRRLRTIFQTNLTVAYSAGRYQADLANIDVAPQWMYDATNNESTCEICAPLDGRVFPADDAFWSTYYPPNHWGCGCSTITLSDEQVRDMGKEVESVSKGEVSGPLPKPGEGWDFNPGETTWKPDLAGYDPELRARFESEGA